MEIICWGPLELKTEQPRYSGKVRSEIYSEKVHAIWPSIAFIPLHYVTIIIKLKSQFYEINTFHGYNRFRLPSSSALADTLSMQYYKVRSIHMFAQISHHSVNSSRQDLVVDIYT